MLLRACVLCRYGANLRAYYKEWKRQEAKPSFWEWLDDESIEVEGVPRTKLESETVLYCDTVAERQKFALSVRDGVIFQDATQEIVETGEDGWIFVLRDGVLYGGQKETKKIPRIHHTSFVGGECVQTAGMMVIVGGRIKTLYPHSGHYRPSEHELLVLLQFLVANGVELRDVEVDVQRAQKVYRATVNGALIRKLDNAHFWKAYRVLNFLFVKHSSWKRGLFDELVERVAMSRNGVSCTSSSDSTDDCLLEMEEEEADGVLASTAIDFQDLDFDAPVRSPHHLFTTTAFDDDPIELLATCELRD